MDLNNPVILLCSEGTRAEFEGRIDDAGKLYSQAWESARNDYEACIAAHYMARHQINPQDELNWNQEALKRAEEINDETVADFFPSLYVNLGSSFEKTGNMIKAGYYYKLAAGLGLSHAPD
jgi:hypothetical protein